MERSARCHTGKVTPLLLLAGRYKSSPVNGGYRNGQVDITVFFVTIS